MKEKSSSTVWYACIFILIGVQIASGASGPFTPSFSGFGHGLQVNTPNMTISLDAAEKIGGVILEQQHVKFLDDQRSENIASPSLRIDIDNHLWIKMQDEEYLFAINPQILRSIINVAESGQPSLVSLIGKAKNQDERNLAKSLSRRASQSFWEYLNFGFMFPTQPPQHLFFIEYHPELHDTLLGLMILLADMSLVDNDSTEAVNAVLTELQRGHFLEVTKPTYSTKTIDFEQPNWQQAKQNPCVDKYKKSDWKGYIISDAEIGYQITINNRNLVIHGEPSYRFWGRSYGERNWLENLNEICSGQSWALLVNVRPVWEHLRQAGFLMALLREYRGKDPKGWLALYTASRKIPIDPQIRTPRTWIVERK